MGTQMIKVDSEDVIKIDGRCKEIFLRHHPEMIGMKLSRKFMVKRLVKFWVESPF